MGISCAVGKVDYRRIDVSFQCQPITALRNLANRTVKATPPARDHPHPLSHRHHPKEETIMRRRVPRISDIETPKSHQQTSVCRGRYRVDSPLHCEHQSGNERRCRASCAVSDDTS